MYDNICKYIAEEFSEEISSWLLGESITLTQLNPTELNVEPIRADSLILLNNEDIILQIEFQTVPDENMAFRMLDYRVRSYRKFPDKAMHQVVIYLKPSNSELIEQNYFRLSNLSYEFDIIKLWEQPTEAFLNSEGLLPLAILSKESDKKKILTQVAQNLEKISEKPRRNNIAACTEILSGLVLDKQIIRQLLREEIMKESVIYQDIIQQGIERGIQQGIQQGIEQGVQENQIKNCSEDGSE